MANAATIALCVSASETAEMKQRPATRSLAGYFRARDEGE